MDNRNIDLTVDVGSWSGTVPGDIVALSTQTSLSLSVDIALLITALITRPPEVFGFSLADAWAWLRYRPAFSDTTDVRLRTEWKDIDPHQKTILSDEVGMGFAVYLCVSELDFKIIANTEYFLKVVKPTDYYLGKTNKTGPQKSPDFVALDSQDRINVLECKGTQQSRKELYKLTESGVSQKSNFRTRSGSTVNHSLVAGLFIPQFSTKEDALLHVKDPFPQLEEILKRITRSDQTIAVTQIALAQHFSLMGLQSMANALATRSVMENEPLKVAGIELEALQQGQDQTYTFRYSLPLGLNAMVLNESDVTRIDFEMSCFKNVYFELSDSNDLNSTLLNVARTAYAHEWFSKSTNNRATLTSPLGFTMSLSYLLALRSQP